MEKDKLNLSFFGRWFSLRELIIKFTYEYGWIWIGLIVVQLIVYTYLFSEIIFTNHTFPNVWLYNYPSFKTLGEGRWLADLIILIQGGSGVQSLQMALAVSFQAFNGIVFALLMGVKGRARIALVAGSVCFYPAFLDYYSFSVDHLTFVLGDTIALFGAYILLKSKKNLIRIGGGSILFMLSIAAYGPKIAMVGFLASVVLLLSFAQHSEQSHKTQRWPKLVETFVIISTTLFLAIFLFWITTRLSINFNIGLRAHTNEPAKMFSEALLAYSWVGSYFLKPGGFPPSLQLIPALLITIGILALVRDIYAKHGIVGLFCCLIVILVQPILLRLSYIINSNSWANAGRILAANGYALVFFMAYGLKQNSFRWIVIPLASISLYFYILLASQENNAAAFKTLYDINFINRITYRIEEVIDSGKNSSISLVVVGNYPDFPRHKYVKYPYLKAQSQFSSRGFENYRQTEILNFFIGKEIFRPPTDSEVQKVISSFKGRSSWPSSESVYLIDDILVVLLQPYERGIRITM